MTFNAVPQVDDLLGFTATVAPDGYRWWYLDGISDDGRYGLTVIGFIGSVFSPYYAWSGRKEPENHVAMNVALYGPKGRWAMTERTCSALHRNASQFAVGPSHLHWSGDALTVHVDEIAVPFPRKLKGTIRLIPEVEQVKHITLDQNGRHTWWPFAPLARIEASFSAPELSWSGHGYFDMNWGTAALEADFTEWDWARATLKDSAVLFYDPVERSGREDHRAWRVDANGSIEEINVPHRVPLASGLWGVARTARSDVPRGARLVRTFVDAPFYTRSELAISLGGNEVPAMHESLNLDRFSSRWVKLLLPFRMPRRSF